MYLPQTPENWKPIPHLSNYEASDKGRIRNTKTGTIRKLLTTKDYYQRISIRGRSRLVHRLIMAAFIGRELTRCEQVRHLDDDGLNNSLANLAIGSAADNLSDRRANDRAGIKLRKRDVQRIRSELRHRPAKVVAMTHGISHAHACNIRSGARYGWLH